MKKIVATASAPFSKSPIAQAVRAGDFIFTAGQGPVSPETGQVVNGSIQVQTRQTFLNLKNILQADGATLRDVVKVTVYLRSIVDFDEFNTVYHEFFPDKEYWPARLTVQAVLGRAEEGMNIEVDMVAYAPSGCSS